MAASLMRFTMHGPSRATAQPFNLGAPRNDGGAVNQYGLPVAPMQFVRHGSAERGKSSSPVRRRPRSRDRAEDRYRTISPAAAAARIAEETNTRNPAGNYEAQEWLQALQDVNERVLNLENAHRNTAQVVARHTGDIDEMKAEFLAYREQVATDLKGHFRQC